LKAYFVEVEQDDTLVAVPFSEPAYRSPRRGIQTPLLIMPCPPGHHGGDMLANIV
jgi:hypothetical protein